MDFGTHDGGSENPVMAASSAVSGGVAVVVVEMGTVLADQQRLETSVSVVDGVLAGQEGRPLPACVVIDVKCGSGKELDGDGESGEYEKMCRICHLSSESSRPGGSELIQLGCGCLDELGTAHRHCAEAWFKVKGDRHCEICGVCPKNITGIEDTTFMEEWNGGRTLDNTGHGNLHYRNGSRRCFYCKILAIHIILALVFLFVFFLK